jgi:predicted HTH transcriptional regulator
VLKSIAAFANTNDGVIYIGIDGTSMHFLPSSSPLLRASADQGSPRSTRSARLELELITPSSHLRAQRHLPLRYARALRRVRR